MPLPLILWVVAAGAGAWGAGKLAGEKSKSQASDIRAAQHALEDAHEKFKSAIEAKLSAIRNELSSCLDDTNAMFDQRGVSTEESGLDAQAILARADLPEYVRHLIDRLQALQSKCAGNLPQVVSSQSAVLAATSRNASYYNATSRYIPPALGALVPIAWAGAMVVESGGKLTAVLQNAHSLSQLETAKAELAASHREQLAAAEAEAAAISGACGDILDCVETLFDARTQDNIEIAQALRIELGRIIHETLA